MTATNPQQRLAKTTSWLAQLRVNAEYAGFTTTELTQVAQERYNKSLEALRVEEAQTLTWEYAAICNRKAEAARAARTPMNGPHSHDCITCYEPVECHRENCRDTMSEHRHCHEGFGRQEFDRPFAHSF